AEIGSRREATAMATASKFKRENEDLKQKLGESISFAAVASINTKLKTNFGNKEGRLLSKYSREHHLEIKKATVQGQRFSEVNSYHRDAWLAIFNIDLTSVFGA
ncbi:BRO-N domain-containing protein, partial [Acinetobacter baumannii]|nr:phage antirepressor protein [Acinetobacter baumannii]